MSDTNKTGIENYVCFNSKGQFEFTVTIKTLKEMWGLILTTEHPE